MYGDLRLGSVILGNRAACRSHWWHLRYYLECTFTNDESAEVIPHAGTAWPDWILCIVCDTGTLAAHDSCKHCLTRLNPLQSPHMRYSIDSPPQCVPNSNQSCVTFGNTWHVRPCAMRNMLCMHTLVVGYPVLHTRFYVLCETIYVLSGLVAPCVAHTHFYVSHT